MPKPIDTETINSSRIIPPDLAKLYDAATNVSNSIIYASLDRIVKDGAFPDTRPSLTNVIKQALKLRDDLLAVRTVYDLRHFYMFVSGWESTGIMRQHLVDEGAQTKDSICETKVPNIYLKYPGNESEYFVFSIVGRYHLSPLTRKHFPNKISLPRKAN